MALIECKNCGKTVSDKATTCPHCGISLLEDAPDSELQSKRICEECGAELSDDVQICPNCGCPIEDNNKIETVPQEVEISAAQIERAKKASSKTLIIILAIVAVVIIIFAGYNINKSNEEKKAAEEAAELSATYAENLETVSYTMLIGAANAEEAGNLIKKVWYNSIYEEKDSETDQYTRKNGTGTFYDDFNDALINLFSDTSFSDTISSIKSNQTAVKELMKDLTNPPEEYEEAYDALKEYYDAYLELTNLVTSPSGSYQTFSTNFNTADSSVSNCYSSMNMYLD